MVKFELTDEQHSTAMKWGYDHECPISYEGAIGGKLTFTFTDTSLGTVEKVVCSCGEEHNLTDFDLW